LAALGGAVVGFAWFLGAGPGLGDAGGEDEVLAEGVALEGVREQEVVEAGVALEVDAEHLVGLAFVPGRARVDVDGGGQRRGVVRDGGADQQATKRGQGDDVGRDAEPCARFVDRAQPVEIGAGEAVARDFQGGEPGRRRDVDRQDLVGLLGRGLRAEEFPGGGGQPGT
jgi:hypothetical protein